MRLKELVTESRILLKVPAKLSVLARGNKIRSLLTSLPLLRHAVVLVAVLIALIAMTGMLHRDDLRSTLIVVLPLVEFDLNLELEFFRLS